MKSALLIYPHQLFEVRHLPQVHTVFMVEDPFYFGVDQQYPLSLHKQKLILHRASMRRYVDEILWPKGCNVEYIEYNKLLISEDIFNELKGFEHVYLFDPVDAVLTQRLQSAQPPGDLSLEFLNSPNFYLKHNEAKEALADEARQPFPQFYQWQRERFNVLIGPDYHPVGGKWSFPGTKPSRIPGKLALPSFQVYGDNKFVREAIKWVDKNFAERPGSTDFIWPTSHAEAAAWLEDFVENRLDHFARYHDSIDADAVWTFHSALGASLNVGLLSPQQVVRAALQRHARRAVELPALELFVRGVLGWREYVRGLYAGSGEELRAGNICQHDRRLSDKWFNGEIGLAPFDNAVRKMRQHAYIHPGERQMIAGSLMLMSEIHPTEAYRWNMSLLIDSFDWVTVPNVYGISQYAMGPLDGAKLHLYTSDDLVAVSNYEKGDWADVWDGLYWRFVENHRDLLGASPQTAGLPAKLDALDPDRKRIISYRAEDFLNANT